MPPHHAESLPTLGLAAFRIDSTLQQLQSTICRDLRRLDSAVSQHRLNWVPRPLSPRLGAAGTRLNATLSCTLSRFPSSSFAPPWAPALHSRQTWRRRDLAQHGLAALPQPDSNRWTLRHQHSRLGAQAAAAALRDSALPPPWLGIVSTRCCLTFNSSWVSTGRPVVVLTRRHPLLSHPPPLPRNLPLYPLL